MVLFERFSDFDRAVWVLKDCNYWYYLNEYEAKLAACEFLRIVIIGII